MSMFIAVSLLSASLRVDGMSTVLMAQTLELRLAPSTFHISMPGLIRMQMVHVLEGVARRLSRPECKRVFQEFHDSSGQPLQTGLDARHQTAAEYLSSLWFVDGEAAARCRSNSAIFAFTTPGSHVISVCGAPFERLFVRDSSTCEILIIHEVLHTLGLGENPPTSANITHGVMERCAG